LDFVEFDEKGCEKVKRKEKRKKKDKERRKVRF
jgi:hypothetical protein